MVQPTRNTSPSLTQKWSEGDLEYEEVHDWMEENYHLFGPDKPEGISYYAILHQATKIVLSIYSADVEKASVDSEYLVSPDYARKVRDNDLFKVLNHQMTGNVRVYAVPIACGYLFNKAPAASHEIG